MWKEVLELLWRIVEAQGLLRDVKRLWAREAKGELFSRLRTSTAEERIFPKIVCLQNQQIRSRVSRRRWDRRNGRIWVARSVFKTIARF